MRSVAPKHAAGAASIWIMIVVGLISCGIILLGADLIFGPKARHRASLSAAGQALDSSLRSPPGDLPKFVVDNPRAPIDVDSIGQGVVVFYEVEGVERGGLYVNLRARFGIWPFNFSYRSKDYEVRRIWFRDDDHYVEILNR